MKTSIKGKTLLSTLAALVAVATLTTGCIMAGGYLRINGEETRDFEEGKVNPQYDYYYSGQGTAPYAVLAVRKNAGFEPGLWQPVAITPEQLMRWNRNIQNEIRVDDRYYGFSVFNVKGEKVGFWYSNQKTPTVFNLDGNGFTVSTSENITPLQHGRFFD